MNAVQREAIVNRLHLAVTLLALWLVLTSPWVSMLRRVPASAGFLDYAHVALGWLAFVLGLAYAAVLMRGGCWKQYVPGTAAGIGGVIEGLLLVAIVATGATGATWFLVHGSSDAITWRGWHILSARALVVLGVAHMLAVASHLLDFVRD
ncbi:MAG: hypothetical protein OEY13_02925 [Gammaproteobacteria bacterium]|nr:hypothetical protein [Gammaproteobacteria bacterium]MDH4310837.1 hypothetical protein [Gammaproteobacteria bacterium]MDH5272010.1 hypothetical protein [Gammaproteobacteria bacterium]